MTRIESDFLGQLELPLEVYYGVQTARALINFQVSGIPLSDFPQMVKALAAVKLAATRANLSLGLLAKVPGLAICQAAEEVMGGKFLDQFPIDVIQGGAGTSTNMNINEVLANRALEILGFPKGDYAHCHPNNQVNLSQSTNDVYPTALRLALHWALGDLMEAIDYLKVGFEAKGLEYFETLKMGRTQLQDAVPMTVGQQFSAYATTVGEDILRLSEASKLILEINLGATAIGTGLNSHPDYAALAVDHLAKITGLALELSPNLIEATWDTGAYVQISGVLKRFAVKISKICNDLRLLSSGPRAGLNEMNLPPRQPGSSIMPGKVNPVIPELVNQVAYDIIGKDVTITLAAEAGQLELNVMEPIIAHSLFEGLKRMTKACRTLRHLCLEGLTINKERCLEMVMNSVGLLTALTPRLGYEMASKLAKEALNSDLPVYDFLLNKKIMEKSELDDLLSTEHLIKPYIKQ
ncbi:MAG: aspartate ammonia-lyase [Deltaproteobacteria bacterium]|jgi:aspartate ammonia-lyase|nr:aspartate ammonia-lyase [Deltaproteobacteria bacterium]